MSPVRSRPGELNGSPLRIRRRDYIYIGFQEAVETFYCLPAAVTGGRLAARDGRPAPRRRGWGSAAATRTARETGDTHARAHTHIHTGGRLETPRRRGCCSAAATMRDCGVFLYEWTGIVRPRLPRSAEAPDLARLLAAAARLPRQGETASAESGADRDAETFFAATGCARAASASPTTRMPRTRGASAPGAAAGREAPARTGMPRCA